MLYSVLKFLHILGVVILLGNVTITAFWKVLADLSDDRPVMIFAQRAVIVADWLFTIPGIVLVLVGGYGMAWVGGYDLINDSWLLSSQVLFALSGLIWLFLLVPLQVKLMRQARSSLTEPVELIRYRKDSRTWLVWGIAATIPLVAALYFMIAKV